MTLTDRVQELELRLARTQRLVRVLALTVLVLTAVVLLPVIVDLLGALLFVGLLGAVVWAARLVAEGEWSRLLAPARAVLASMKPPRPA